MNKIKVTLSESNPPRIGDELEIGGKVLVCSHVTDSGWFARFTADWFEPVTFERPEWLGLVVTRTEEEDGA